MHLRALPNTRATMLFRILGHAIASGLTATMTSTGALAAAALAEGKGPAQPLNATSHIVYGNDAAHYRDADIDHTIIGLGTHAAATVFWAAAFETSLVLRPARTPAALVGRAGSIALMAALVDYTVTPKRFTPGWELVLSKTSIAVVYAAMAAGFAGAASRR
jgi:hypothetical protein